MCITAMPIDSVTRAGLSYRSVIVTYTDDESGHTYSRRYFYNRHCEDYVDTKRVPQFSSMLPDRVLSDAWGWIGEQALRFLRTGTKVSRTELVDLARSL